MSIESIKNSVVAAAKAAPKKVLKGTNTVGNFVAEKAPILKNKKDVFVGSLDKMGKNTAVGAAVIGAGLALAIGCIKTIHSKVCEVSKQDK